MFIYKRAAYLTLTGQIALDNRYSCVDAGFTIGEPWVGQLAALAAGAELGLRQGSLPVSLDRSGRLGGSFDRPWCTISRAPPRGSVHVPDKIRTSQDDCNTPRSGPGLPVTTHDASFMNHPPQKPARSHLCFRFSFIR